MKSCILYLHHKNDSLAWDNYKNLSYLHPNSKVIPVAFGLFADRVLAHTRIYLSERNKKLTALFKRGEMDYYESLAWSAVHELIIGGFEKNPSHDDYFVVEYDCFLNCPMFEFFEEPKKEITFVKPMTWKETTDWEWFNLYQQSNAMWPKVQNQVRGAGICALQHYTHDALAMISSALKCHFYDNMLSELALGTAASSCHYIPEQWQLKSGEPVGKYFQPNERLLGEFDKERKEPLWFHPKKD